MTRLLIAHPSPEMSAAIEDMLDEALGERQAAYVNARNVAKVWMALEAEVPDILIINLDLAADRTSGVERWSGLALAGELRARWPELPLVLTAPHTTNELSERVLALGHAGLVLEGRRFEEHLGKCVSALVACEPDQTPAADAATADGGARVAGEPTRFVVEIHLRAGGNCDYRARSVSGLVPFNSDLSFAVKTEQLQELISLTSKLGDSKCWLGDYEKLGDRLRGVLLEADIEVIKDLATVCGHMQSQLQQPGAIPAICFVVDKGLHPIALEALRQRSRNDDYYWLQKAPVWRRLALNGSSRFPLFTGSEAVDSPINCLVVEAAAAGKVEGLGIELAEIPGVKEESLSLMADLRKKSKVPIGKICRIRCRFAKVVRSIRNESGEWQRQYFDSFSDALRDTLTSGEPWQLVHYAGHSYYDADNDYGYFVLPGDPRRASGELDYVGVTEVAQWLSRTRFVYMSSCKSASQDFVFSLCAQGVPALAGFRWGIEDKSAIEHSRNFYRGLFEHRSIEAALFKTWNHMYGRHRGERVWASSQLVMQ